MRGDRFNVGGADRDDSEDIGPVRDLPMNKREAKAENRRMAYKPTHTLSNPYGQRTSPFRLQILPQHLDLGRPIIFYVNRVSSPTLSGFISKKYDIPFEFKVFA